jgi:small conductance mechanosensitive channel
LLVNAALLTEKLPIKLPQQFQETQTLVRTCVNVALVFLLLFCANYIASAQTQKVSQIASAQAAEIQSSASPDDLELDGRIEAIFSNIETLSNIDVEVNSGVVNLSGTVASDDHLGRAKGIVNELSGVVAVESGVEITLDVESNVAPLLANLKSDVRRLVRSMPVFGIAFLVFLLISIAGNFLGRLSGLWARIARNLFIGELIGQAIKVVSIAIGLVVALNIVGAKSVIGTVLGGAGVIGLAIGFAVRDSLENYISSIMLSLRQPFRSKDRVKIGDHEGIVVRLTSRATVLMTSEGNHLRIQNSTVFKANIVNFTTNPERRFEFKLTVDDEGDALVAISAALIALRALKFILKRPKASATIDKITSSGAELSFTGWVDQAQSDFNRCRSLALLTVQDAIKQSADHQNETVSKQKNLIAEGSGVITYRGSKDKFPWSEDRQKLASSVLDISADTDLERRANEDRQDPAHTDLLDQQQPTE